MKSRLTAGAFTIVLILFVAQCGRQSDANSVDTGVPALVDFNFHVKPILSDRCFACHGPDKNQRKAELRLDQPEGLFKKRLSSGKFAVVPGKLNKSEAFTRLISHDPDRVMPPPESNLQVSEAEIAIIRAMDKTRSYFQRALGL